MERQEQIMQLIDDCRKGNELALHKIFKSFHSCAMSVCMRYANDYDEASDMLNEGFLKVFSNLKKFDGNGSFEAWLKRVMANAALDYIRKYHKNVKFVDIDETAEVFLSDNNLNDAISKISSKEIFDMIQQLPDTTKTVFNMFVFEGYSHSEIASFLGITENTSAWHVNNARNRLKKAIVLNQQN